MNHVFAIVIFGLFAAVVAEGMGFIDLVSFFGG